MSALACTARPRTVALTAPQTAGRITFDDTGRLPRGQSVAPCPDVGRLTRPDGHGKLGAVPVESDFLVLGSGIAGLTCALECARAGRVVLVTKDRLPESNSRYAQGGIASVWSPEDSFESHIADTLAAGDGLCHRDTVEVVVREGPERVRDLIALGTNFDLRGDPDDHEYDLGREGGHSKRRILHATDATGREVIRALSEAVRASPNIAIHENHLAVDLLLERGERPVCWGAYVLDRETRRVIRFPARATFLCTGGAGKVYLYTSNPDVATGDGVAMAYRAGAPVANMEFFQFHPTCLYHPQAKSFLVTEALRGEGAGLGRAHPRWTASTPAARWRARACTARTAWPRTRSSRRWCSRTAPRATPAHAWARIAGAGRTSGPGIPATPPTATSRSWSRRTGTRSAASCGTTSASCVATGGWPARVRASRSSRRRSASTTATSSSPATWSSCATSRPWRS